MDDLISEFITETNESIAVLDLELVKLEKNPEDTVILGTIFRVMHTIKGTCGFLGLPRLEHLAHAAENVLGKIRDKELTATPQAVTLILESLDNIKGLIEYLSSNGAEQEGEDDMLIAKLNHFAETGVVGDVPAATPAAAAPTTNGAGADPFPFFKGEDEPELKAAMDKILATKSPDQVVPVPEKDDKPAAVASAAPAPAPKAEVKAEAKPAEGKEDANAANQSIRVSIDVLENLMQMVSELVLTRNQLMQIVRTKEDKDFMNPLQQLSHITTELQDGVMKTRMQPIGNAWSKFPRLIRDLSMELGKKIELKMNGAETELDRQLLEVIKDPLTHMVRNSCDHGLEKPDERIAAGKPEMGTVTLSAYHEGGHIIIEIKDDGRGINIERVKQKAITNGIATEAQLATMSEKQIAQFVFAPGFSTAEKITSVSGRGVGMDVVKTNIEKIGGTLDLDSTWGKGSKVGIKIPLTLAIVSVLLVEVSGQKFAIPQINVLELVRVSKDSDLSLETIKESLVLRLRNKLIPIAVLSEILGFPADHDELMNKNMCVAVCKVGGYDFGILVDRVFDTEEIVVKPVAGILKNISVYSGNTILGDGSVIMILDPNGLVKLLGNVDIGDDTAALEREKNRLASEALVGFLLFGTGKGAPKSVPLELISRLEEIDVSNIEVAGDQPVVQYRGDLMRLIMLDDNDFSLPATGSVDVIVFSYDKTTIGLVVKEIIDIIYTPFVIKLSSKESKNLGYLGSMVIAGKSTDVVDVAYLLSDLVEKVVAEIDTSGRKKTSDCNVLLVEDSPFFRNMMVPFFNAAGYQITAVETATEALKILGKESASFDMIVTDIEMPGMDGYEFAATCRSTPQLGKIPIVAYTSSMSDETIRKSKAAGMNDCIVKSDRSGLLDSVYHWLLADVNQVRH